MRILVAHGANLNRLGKREPTLYGSETSEDILAQLQEKYPFIHLDYFQSNIEGELINRLQATLDDGTQAIIINAGAWSHSSYALYDTLLMLPIPKIEIHLTNIYGRNESFRHHSVLSAACDGVIAGFGKRGYFAALDILMPMIDEKK